MDPVEFRRAIERKRDGEALDAATWAEIVRAYVADEIDEAPVAALMMACVWRGLNSEEIFALTSAMVDSGEVVELGFEAVDKHSSGGVGDTVSLIAVPLVAACGVRVAKLSGGALGHTGGTLDKLEAIAGVTTSLGIDRFREIVARVGCALGAQTARLVPADKKLYALRDRTGTVPSVGLIAASIVSKKIAGGAQGIVYDVKCGLGSFVRSQETALDLAGIMVRLTERFGRRAIALVTDMNEPLGPAIGTGVEAIEARDFLRGTRRNARLELGIREIASAMLELGGRSDPARAIERALDGGEAYAKFVAMIEAQGGSRRALENAIPLPARAVVASSGGFVEGFDTVALGELAHDLVAADGPFAGVRLAVRTGEAIAAGEVVADVYGGDDITERRTREAIAIGPSQTRSRTLTIGSIRSNSPSRITSAIK